MYTILLVIFTLSTLFLIGIILLQRSDSDSTGLSGGGGNFMSGRASANLMTRTTAILATIFMSLSLILAVMVSQRNSDSVAEKIEKAATEAPAANSEKTPAAPASQSVPKLQ